MCTLFVLLRLIELVAGLAAPLSAAFNVRCRIWKRCLIALHHILRAHPVPDQVGKAIAAAGRGTGTIKEALEDITAAGKCIYFP